MSRENVEVVQRALEAFNRRDLEALAEASHPDIEFSSVLAALDGGTATFRGLHTWGDYFDQMDQTWQDWQIEDIRLFDGGDDEVAAVCSIGGVGRLSGVRAHQVVGLANERARPAPVRLAVRGGFVASGPPARP